jgi:hypothetical protein
MSKSLTDSYSGVNEEYLNSLSKEELLKILMTIITTPPVNSADFYPCDVYMPDTLADIIRQRQ